MGLIYKHQRIEIYPGKLLSDSQRRWSPFDKRWTEELEILERELRMLDYRRGSVVIETFHSDWDLRKDGMLRSDARKPEYPAVVLRFEVWDSNQNRYEQMFFECDTFFEWKGNVRAIAEALQSLRKVDRYGVSSRGQTNAHYKGYKALPAQTGQPLSASEAANFIAKYSDFPPHALENKENLKSAYRQAAKLLHPDSPDYNGNPENIILLKNAKDVLSKIFF